MKIAELFVALGFKVEGDDILGSIDKRMDKAASTAGKLALGVDAITTGLLFMADTALNAAVGLNKFFVSTGLSSTELQQWQHTAALANVSGQELEQTVRGLQEVGPKIMLNGGSGAAPWLLLGLNPNMDPFEMLKQLHKALQNVTPDRLAAARVIAQQAGIGADMFQLLRQKNLPVDALKEQYILTSQNQEKLMALNAAWKNVKDESGRVSNKFLSELAPALTKLLDLVTYVIDKGAEFVKWLNGGTDGADTLRHVLQFLSVALIVVAPLLTVFAGAMKLAAVTMAAFDAEAAPWLLGIAAIAVGAIAAADAVMVLVSAIKHFNDANHPTDAQSKTELEQIGIKQRRNYKDVLRDQGGPSPQGSGYGYSESWRSMNIGDVLGHPSQPTIRSGNTTSVHVEKIQIDGSRDPQATGRAVVDILRQQLTSAGSNAPAPNY